MASVLMFSSFGCACNLDLLSQHRKPRLLDNTNQRVKVDVVCGQPMNTIGWHYANLLQTYVGLSRRHQSQIKEEQMEAEDYNSSMSPETEDQHSPDTNHNPEYTEEPGFSSSPHAFHC